MIPWFRRAAGQPRTPPRKWFRDKDGTYYRNCPLIKSEQDEVMAWPGWTPFKSSVLDSLTDEWRRVFRQGATRKAALDPGDVVVVPAPFREAYPDKPGLWFLDEAPS